MKSLAAKTILITGGAKGVGAASARLFAQEGARVIVADRDGEAAAQLAEEFRANGLDLQTICADVSKVDGAQRAFDEAMAQAGRIDVLFNHAGIILVKPFLDCTLAEWDELMDNNAKSAFLMTRLVLPQMLERGKGTLVSVDTGHLTLSFSWGEPPPPPCPRPRRGRSRAGRW